LTGTFSTGNFSTGFRVKPVKPLITDDAELIQETLAGDSGAFGQLVRKYQDRLFHTMVHVAGSVAEAEDVVQEAFVQAFVKLSSFKGNSAFYTWLYRIAFNTSISRRRKQRPAVSVEAHQEQTGQEPLDVGMPVSDNLEREERAHLVRAALEQLSEEHRTVLVLREMDGFCYETIAQMLDLPVGTVRSRLHRARHEMRGLLKDILQQPS